MKINSLIQATLLPVLCLFGAKIEATRRSIYKCENDVQDKIKVFAPKIAKDNNFDLLNTGIGSVLDAKRVAWDINLKADRSWTVEQARPVVVNMVQEFINLVYKNPAFRIYLQEGHEQMPWYAPELGPDRIGIKLAFWDKNVDRPLPPYLAQIRVVDGKILYFQANPADQSLQEPPFSETIEEAFARVNRTLVIPQH